MKKEKVFGKKEYSEINELLNRKINEKKILVAVHRGTSAGNIIENTVPAYRASLLSGGDMIEVDVIKSTDGIYYAFHDGNEKRLLNKRKNIKEMSSGEIEKNGFNNSIGEKTEYKTERLDTVLKYFEGKDVLINIDRAWEYFEDLLVFFDKYNVRKQLIIKSAPEKEFFEIFRKHKVKYMYMPIVKTEKDVELTLNQKNINIVGFELIAENEKSLFFKDEYIGKLQKEGYFVWVNSIKLNDLTNLYAGYDDSKAILEGFDKGWGVLINKGVDIIQTDWPSLLAGYIKELKKRF
ncbi:MAG: glycerophosphodiester phosphodiesterase family protein [Leptotrichiaceae bacterium]|nr:glycerophosphodiester phosphodiesterase family protein [Leptotrichiaceae bacterium]